MRLYRSYIAEGIATFTLIFMGAGSILANQVSGGAIGITGIALAHGLALITMIYATAHISGAHINPAVTIAMLVTKRIDALKAAGYIGAQLLGATVAGLVLKMIFEGYPDAITAVTLGTPTLGANVSMLQGIVTEAVMTFFLVFVIFGVAVDKRAPTGFLGLAIGLTVAADILIGGPLTGGAMNPARAFGPALTMGFWDDHLVYWLGPIIGGLLGALTYQHVMLEPEAVNNKA